MRYNSLVQFRIISLSETDRSLDGRVFTFCYPLCNPLGKMTEHHEHLHARLADLKSQLSQAQLSRDEIREQVESAENDTERARVELTIAEHLATEEKLIQEILAVEQQIHNDKNEMR